MKSVGRHLRPNNSSMVHGWNSSAGREENDRQVRLLSQAPQELLSVHARHLDVGIWPSEIWRSGFEHQSTLDPVGNR